MQSGIAVSGNAISGTLKYVDGGWDAGTWSVEESTGNYLAIKVASEEDAVITVELVNGVHGPVTLDADRNVVLRVTNSATQKVKVVSTVGGESATKIFDLSGLTLES